MTPTKPILPLCICGDSSCDIHYGLCHCGCGKHTLISLVNRPPRNLFKGKPTTFIRGHSSRIRPIPEDAVPFKIEGVYCRLVALQKGFHTIIDEVEYQRVMRYHWTAMRVGHTYYVVRNLSVDEEKERQKTQEYLHEFLLPVPDGMEVDHQNRTGLDNRSNNLRPAKRFQNSMNSRRKVGKSGYRNVIQYGDSFSAFITINGRRKYLGRRNTAIKAHALFVAAATERDKDFARFD